MYKFNVGDVLSMKECDVYYQPIFLVVKHIPDVNMQIYELAHLNVDAKEQVIHHSTDYIEEYFECINSK